MKNIIKKSLLVVFLLTLTGLMLAQLNHDWTDTKPKDYPLVIWEYHEDGTINMHFDKTRINEEAALEAMKEF